MIETAALLEQYTDYIPSIGYDYRKNPWYGYINQDTSYQSKNEVKGDLSAVSQFLQVLIPLQQEISEKYKIQCTSVEDAQLWNSFFGFAATSKLITPSLLDRERFDAVNSALHKLQAQSADIMAARSVLGAVFDDDIYKLDGAAYHKKLTKQFGGIFSRLFNAEYKQLITDLRLCKKDGKKPAYNEAVSMTERLAYYQQKTLEFVEAEAPIKAFLGEAYHGVETEWDYVAEQMSALGGIFSSSIAFGTLEHYNDFTSERDIFADYHQKLDETFAVCSADTFKRVDGYFDRAILNTHSAPCNLVLARLADCLSEMDKLDMDSVYFRAPVFYRTTGKAYSLEEQLKRSQWSAFIRNMIVFDKAQWINYPPSVYQSENKLYQLKIAKECGMAVPETYIGNVLPNNIIPEKIYIVKSLDTALFYNNGKEMFTYSTMISGQELLEADLKLAPIILQEYLESKTDLRVTVVGDQIFPVAIMKHGKSITGDWRKTSKDDLEYIPVELPWGVTSQIIALMKKLNLTFGGIDLALVGGTYYFIEVNPTGEWGWLASVVNLPIDKAIVKCMTGANAHG